LNRHSWRAGFGAEQGKLADTIHGALLVYDLPDLVASYRTSKK